MSVMFTHERVSDSIIRIKDITKTAIYLVIGEERACLIDTGCGIGNLRQYIHSLIDVPYDVILTHGHVDHASGAELFSDKKVYVHDLDIELMRYHTNIETRKAYAKHTNIQEEIAEDEFVPLYDFSKVLSLYDGQIFNLGKRTLHIIHTPGHTQGMCMVLIREDRTIVFGDGCGVNVMLLDTYATSVETYLRTLLSLKCYEDQYDIVLRNHGSYASSKKVLDNVIDCCKCVMNHTDDHIQANNLVIDCDDAFLAKKRDVVTRYRMDGKEGNLIYRADNIHDIGELNKQ